MTDSVSSVESGESSDENCVVILAPSGQDAPLIGEMLDNIKTETRRVFALDEFVRQLPGCAAGILTIEALNATNLPVLQAGLQDQPLWSDTPLILLTGHLDPAAHRLLAESLGNITIVQRPLESASLLTIIQTAVRARQKQYQVRALIDELEGNKRNLDLAINGAQLGTFYCNFPFDKIIWNDTCKTQFFVPHDAEVNFALFYSLLHPDDREATRHAIEKCVNDHVQYNVEYRVVSPSGQIRWINAIGRTYYDTQGSPFRFDGITVDITEKKSRERALNFLVELNDATRTLHEPVEIMTTTTRMLGKHLGVSRCAYAPMEADENHFTIYEDYTDGLVSSAGHYTLATLGRRAEEKLRAGQVLIIRDRAAEATPDDALAAFKMIQIQAIICTALLKDGKLVALMAVHQKEPRRWTDDEIQLVEMVSERSWAIIERAKAHTQLEAHAAEISALNDRLQRSMTETHHRVKNNLQVIAAMIEMQTQEYEAANAVPLEQYRQLKAHVHTLAIVHELLTKNIKEDENTQRVSIKAVLEQILPMLQSTAWNQSIDYFVGEAHLSPKQCIALSLILNELVSNALKHGDKKARVVFRADETHAVLEIHDDGKGFAPNFDPIQAANTGLELVESLVRTDLRGKSHYETQSAGGGKVTITFALPLSDN